MVNNWSTNLSELEKQPAKLMLWKLEQLINFGLSGEKLPVKHVRKNINHLDIDPSKKEYLKFLLK